MSRDKAWPFQSTEPFPPEGSVGIALKFSTVSAALHFYYRKRERIVHPPSGSLEPREVDQSVRTDILEAKLAECLTVGVHTRGLSRLERFVLDNLYGDQASLEKLRQNLLWATRHELGFPWREQTPRRDMRADNKYLIEVRRRAEDKVAKKLEERGLLNGSAS